MIQNITVNCIWRHEPSKIHRREYFLISMARLCCRKHSLVLEDKVKIILGFRWSDFVSNERLLKETRIRFVTCIFRERPLQLYGHVAHFPDADPAHQILSAKEPREWRRPMAQPRTCGCSRLISISRRWGWARHLPGGGQKEAPGSRKWMQRRAALAHAPIPDLTCLC